MPETRSKAKYTLVIEGEPDDIMRDTLGSAEESGSHDVPAWLLSQLAAKYMNASLITFVHPDHDMNDRFAADMANTLRNWEAETVIDAETGESRIKGYAIDFPADTPLSDFLQDPQTFLDKYESDCKARREEHRREIADLIVKETTDA